MKKNFLAVMFLSVFSLIFSGCATTGPQGPAGPTGPSGPQGPQGLQGPSGLTNGISNAVSGTFSWDTTANFLHWEGGPVSVQLCGTSDSGNQRITYFWVQYNDRPFTSYPVCTATLSALWTPENIINTSPAIYAPIIDLGLQGKCYNLPVKINGDPKLAGFTIAVASDQNCAGGACTYRGKINFICVQ